MNGVFCFFLLASLLQAPTGDLTLHVEADRKTMRLSDHGQLIISLEGPAPLVVTLPANWPAEESSSAWRARPAGDAQVTPLANGRERWTLPLRIDPYAAGDSLVLSLNPLTVRFGPNSRSESVSIPPVSIQVTTDIQSVQTSEARSITGIESVPAPVARNQSTLIVFGLVFLVVVMGGMYYAWRRTQRRAETVAYADDLPRQLQELKNQTDPRQLAIGVAALLRSAIAQRYGISLDCLTARESSRVFHELERVPASVDREEFAVIMRECERIQYDPFAQGECQSLLERTQRWLESLNR
ncbi:MAG: hypothetical protein U0798_10630 [Gemmataceae bacterium]